MFFSKSKKYYLVTYYNTFYEVKYKGKKKFKKDITTYIFKTKMGDLHLCSHPYIEERSNNFITEEYEDVLLELSRRIYQGKDVKRCPMPNEVLLQRAIKRYPDKLI